MKLFTRLVLALTLSLPTLALADEVGYIDCQKRAENTQVLGKAAKTTEIVASLPCGERFTILVNGQIFTRIQTKDGKVGYIYSSFISREYYKTSLQPQATASGNPPTPNMQPSSVTPAQAPTTQDPSVAATPAVLADPSAPFTLLDGTPIKLRLDRTISSASERAGNQLNFEVMEEVLVNGVVVLPKGSVAIGTVTEAEPKKRLGRGGKLNVNIDYVRLANNEKAALRAVQEGKGGGHIGVMTGGIVATSLVFFPAAPFFLFMHGKDITIPKGTEITAFTSGDIRLEPSRFGVRSAQVSAVNQSSAASQPTAATPVDFALSTVAFRASPDGADITIDGQYVGSTPSTISLKPGDHTVVIQKPSYTPWQRTLTVAPGASLTVNATLETR